jgi:hypothetical protein
LDEEAKSAGEFVFSEARDTGTIFHLLAQFHHTGLPFTLDISDWPVDELKNAAAEALRLFTEYAKRYPQDAWGRVLGAEVQLSIPLGEGPTNTVTGAADLIVDIDEAYSAILGARLHTAVEPGVYLVDHKTHGSINQKQSLIDAFALSGWSYQLGCQAIYGARFKGMFYNHIIRHKKLEDKSFFVTFVEAPAEGAKEKLRKFLSYSQALKVIDAPNLGACAQGYDICQHRITGACTLL